jgi:hypothetical protein
VSVILTLLGIVLLVPALAGIGLGVYMATNPNTRELGRLFALWWIPGAAAASGVLMRDLVTFTVGSVCFLVAGAVFLLKGLTMRKAHLKRGEAGGDQIPETSRPARKSRKTAS